MRPISRTGGVLAVATALLLAATALVWAASQGPKTDPTQATFTAQRTDSKARTCTGQDGTYSDARERYAGTITGDPRLSGKLIVKVHTLVNQETGLGTTRGNVRILDADTNRVRAHGKFRAVNTEGGTLNGFIAGHVRAQGDAPRRDARLWANFRAQVSEQGSVTGELGGGASENTAVIQSGKCGRGANAKPAKPKPGPKPGHQG